MRWCCARFAAMAVLAGLFLAGCSTPKLPERFYTLTPAEPPAPAPATAPLYVDVLPISVPAEVDRSQWVVRQGDGSVLVLEQDRWAAPLADELRSAVVQRLGSRWGAVDVRGVASLHAEVWRVRVDVQRFESGPGREARIDAAWSLLSSQPGAAPPLVCRSILREPAGEGGVAALAAAHRRAVQRLADEIGQRLQTLQQGRAANC